MLSLCLTVSGQLSPEQKRVHRTHDNPVTCGTPYSYNRRACISNHVNVSVNGVVLLTRSSCTGCFRSVLLHDRQSASKPSSSAKMAEKFGTQVWSGLERALFPTFRRMEAVTRQPGHRERETDPGTSPLYAFCNRLSLYRRPPDWDWCCFGSDDLNHARRPSGGKERKRKVQTHGERRKRRAQKERAQKAVLPEVLQKMKRGTPLRFPLHLFVFRYTSSCSATHHAYPFGTLLWIPPPQSIFCGRAKVRCVMQSVMQWDVGVHTK